MATFVIDATEPGEIEFTAAFKSNVSVKGKELSDAKRRSHAARAGWRKLITTKNRQHTLLNGLCPLFPWSSFRGTDVQQTETAHVKLADLPLCWISSRDDPVIHLVPYRSG